MKKKKVIISIIITILLVGIIAIFIYLNTYYKAEEIAFEYLKSSEEVLVSEIDEGYFFDGPGTEYAMIFYPGAKVDTVAYSRLMHMLAQNGTDCFLLDVPFHFAFFGQNLASNVIDEYDYENWYLGGHSLGGVIASQYAAKHKDTIDGLLLLASYANTTIPDSIKVISIHGDKDGILNEENYNDAKKYLPENAKEYIIPGANHAIFANYGKQKGDGDATIGSDEVLEFVLEKVKWKS